MSGKSGFFRRLLKSFTYLGAGVVILLAIAVGLFRLFLPRLPEYQDDIKEWASAAIGMQVEFSGMDARWGLSGPELEFYDAELIREDGGARIVAAEEVRVGIGFLRLLFERQLVVDRLVIRDTSVDVRQLDDGSFRIQGVSVNDLLASYTGNSASVANIEILGEDIELRFMQPGDTRPLFFSIPDVRVSIDQKRIAVDADIRLPDDLGRQLSVSAIQVLALPVVDRSWDLRIDADKIHLSGWSELSPGERRFRSGTGDLELAIAVAGQGVTNVSAEVDFNDIALGDEDPFDISGRVEVNVSERGWLVAADEFAIAFADHEWPESSLRVEASVGTDGVIGMLDMRASYLNLSDLSLLEPWLNENQQQVLADYAPSGSVRNLSATVSDLDGDEPRFKVAAELDRVGVRDAPRRPGVRGFSGLVRADRRGGLLEIYSRNMEVHAPEYLATAIVIGAADGTIVWRNGHDRTTILSDGIAVRNEFLDSQSNVQLVLSKDGSSPEIDLASTWSISDIAAAKRYIPQKGLPPKLYEWFQAALVSGTVSDGRTSLNGPLDKFPFDGGEGRLLTEATIRDMTFKYHPAWPAAEQARIEVVVDNARLYSVKNHSHNAGISVADAEVDIPNLREPVLSIESDATASLESIRDFSMQSPIAKILGGQLDRISVSGEASFNLMLTVPLKKGRIQEFEFVARARSNNGTLAVAGFKPPITDLSGEVTIERDSISSEGLAGRFLGEAVNLSLRRSDDPQFSVIASAEGIVTGDAIVSELGAPLEGIVSGAAPYQARILFPSNKVEVPSPLTVEIDSALQGLAVGLPEPVSKSADSSLPVSGEIRFIPGGKVIESSGTAGDRLAWQLAFNRPEGRWDLDRGVLTLGGEVLQQADTRGLHIRGATAELRLQDWLDLSRSGEKNVGAADRIRSIDVLVEDLYLIGQHLRGHRIKVDRSARDWLVQFDGDDIVGSVFVPYDFSGDRAMVLEMQKLRLPGDDTEGDTTINFDPRRLPPIHLTVAEFAFGDRYLGAAEATVEKTERGLAAVSISTSDPSYKIVGTGRWEVDENDPSGSRSFISATLTSTNVKETMMRLNFQPGIVSKKMTMVFDLDWSGSPRADFFDVLDGEVQVRFGNGQLEEVKPGAGRVFGLMSIGALPRRLSLDFRDVFNKGFGFDKITGSFTIDNGKTLTCDLSLAGPAADIGIVGEADIANRTYDQTAMVSANVGNTLPIVGAVVAGPQVAAALLIFSQIFKKPLQEVGQVYYGISGSWDEPNVESTNSSAFVASGELAGCLADRN